MFGPRFQRKYALTEQGARNAKQGTFWTVIVNLLVMGGTGILVLLTRRFLATWSDGAETFRPKGHDIVFENVGFAYDSEQVLKGVSFTAKEGEVTVLVGPSGSGKSTCARLAARLWDVTEGAIRVGGVDISKIDPETLLTDYAMVFQDVMLFDDTVMENIRLGKHGATDGEVLAAAKAANCDEFVKRLPQGYATPIGENGAKLSGGERQRIMIRRRKIERFIETVKGLPELITEFDTGLWAGLVDSMTVYSKDRIVFRLTCGMEVES